MKIIIIGGGAAGFFTAISAAEAARKNHLRVDISILEMSPDYLKKVRISGGGRCNVTHHIFEPRPFVAHYPRGEKELLQAMQRFQAKDTVEWFANHGVQLVPEKDGRMFPSTNTSETVIECFLNTAKSLGIKILPKHNVGSIEKSTDGKFNIKCINGENMTADSVMIATGSSPAGYKLAQSLGHQITDLAPSLFSFKIEDPLLNELSGLSFENAQVKILLPNGVSFKEQGPLLITHWGLSGPAVLKISAWAAREMKQSQYKAKLVVNWMQGRKLDEILGDLKSLKDAGAKGHVSNTYPEELAKRFWLKMLSHCQIPEDKRWADISGKELGRLAEGLFSTNLEVTGKNRYKDEFVECGGVNLKEIDFKKMESKVCPGLYFAGEILDIDGITGGFNFQAAWTGGFIAGQNMILK